MSQLKPFTFLLADHDLFNLSLLESLGQPTSIISFEHNRDGVPELINGVSSRKDRHGFIGVISIVLFGLMLLNCLRQPPLIGLKVSPQEVCVIKGEEIDESVQPGDLAIDSQPKMAAKLPHVAVLLIAESISLLFFEIDLI